MIRYASWVVNTLLFGLCCFLAADTANAIIAAWLAPERSAPQVAHAEARVDRRDWSDRQVILDRNLFHSTDAVADTPPAPEPDEDLEETNLPLKLWGTIASENPDLAWASIQDLDDHTGSPEAVAVGEQIKSATVVAIERRRVVLLEHGARRALSLDDEEGAAMPSPSARAVPTPRSRVSRSPRIRNRPSRRSQARQTAAERIRQVAENRFEVDRSDVEEAVSNPATLYSQARIVPRLDDEGQIEGIEISSIKPGSVFEQVGIQDGEIITEIGGVPVGEVGQSGEIVKKLTQEPEVPITIEDADGNLRTTTFQVPGADQ